MKLGIYNLVIDADEY